MKKYVKQFKTQKKQRKYSPNSLPFMENLNVPMPTIVGIASVARPPSDDRRW